MTGAREATHRAGDLAYIGVYMGGGCLASYGAAIDGTGLMFLGVLVVLGLFAFACLAGVSARTFGYGGSRPPYRTEGRYANDRYRY